MMPTDPLPLLSFFGLTILRFGVPLLVVWLVAAVAQRYQGETA